MSAPRIVPTGVLGGINGKDGSNVLPTDTAIKQAIQDPASQTAAALTASYGVTVPASGDTTGATDTTALNAALSAARTAGGDVVRGVPGSAYFINAALLVGSNVTLDMTGCDIREAANAHATMVANYSAMNPAATGTAILATTSNKITTSLAAQAQVGQSIVVQGAAAHDGPFCGLIANVNSFDAKLSTQTGVSALTSLPVVALTQACAAGVVRLRSRTQEQSFTTTGAAQGATSIPVSSTTPIINFTTDTQVVVPATTTNIITVTNLDGTPIAATTSVSGAVARLYNRDVRPKIVGGRWNRGVQSFAPVGLNDSVCRLHHADNPAFTPEYVTTEALYNSHGVVISDVRNTLVDLPDVDYGADVLHVCGPTYGLEVPRVIGTAYDDMFVITASDWANANQPTSGNVVGVHVGLVDGQTQDGATMCKIIAGAGNFVDDIVVDLVRGGADPAGGESNQLLLIGDDPNTEYPATQGGTYGSVRATVVAPVKSTGQIVKINSPQADYIHVHVLAQSDAQFGGCVDIGGTSTATINHLQLSGAVNVRRTTGEVYFANVDSAGLTINTLTLDKVAFTANPSAAGGGLARLAAGIIGVFEVLGCTARNPVGSDNQRYAVNVAGTSMQVRVINFAGGTVAGPWNGALIYRGSTSAEVTFSNGFAVTDAAHVGVVIPTTGSPTVTFVLAGLVLRGITDVNFYKDGPNLVLVGDGFATDSTAAWVYTGGGGTVRAIGARIRADVAYLARTGLGDTAYNTSAGASCGVGPVISSGSGAAGSWKNLVTGATY